LGCFFEWFSGENSIKNAALWKKQGKSEQKFVKMSRNAHFLSKNLQKCSLFEYFFYTPCVFERAEGGW